MQPFFYLNDFADSCLPTVLGLRPEVVHAHDLVTLSAGILVAHHLKARLIYDAHELEQHTNYHSLNRWTKYWIARYETAFAIRADAVVTVCDSIAEWLAETYRIRKPVVINNAPSASSPILSGVRANDTVRSRIGADPGTPVAVYVGSITVDRGLDLCVRALEHLPTVHFAAVGPRYRPTEIEMKDTAHDVGAAERLHFIDPVPSARVMSFISDADCSVMAIQNVCLSYYYCFPNKLLESVLAGIPVVVSDLLELRQFVEKFHVGVVVDGRDPRSIAAGIRKVLASPHRYAPSSALIASIEETYGWAEQRRRLGRLYGGLRTERCSTARKDPSQMARGRATTR